MTTVTDDFNRANGAVGAAWTMVPTGDGTPTFSIVSNKVQNTATGGSFGKYARHDTATGSDDMYAQAVVSSTQTNAGSNSGVLVRGQTGSTNTSYQFTGRHAGDTLSFWKIVAGTETNLRLACNGAAGAQTLSRAWASGDTIREEVVGSLLRGKHNGVLVAVTRDTSTATGQRGGLNDYNAAVGDLAEFDNFQAGPLDDLTAPYVAGVSAQVEGTGSLTPTIPANVTAGDLVLVHGTILSATNTLVLPSGEGWSSAQTTAGNSHGSQVFAKIWGLGGQTDDTTPTFTKSAGTEGAAATAVIIRNPLHATRPWTSVADAVLATGAQNNASSATVTAPSVSHTGDDRTVCRFFGSNDDNSLGLTTAALSNSEGALVYGGLDYDFAAGTDGAQAFSILENVDLAGSTGTATVTEHVNGNDANHGITLVLGIPAAVTNLTVADAAHAQTADGVALTQVHTLAAAEAAQTQSVDSVALSQVHNLVVADATHTHTADNVAPGVSLTVQDATQVQVTDSPALAQDHQVVVADAIHVQTVESPTLTQTHALAVADTEQAQTADEVAVGQVHVLTVSDASQAQTADAPSLTQIHELATADAAQTQTADGVTLTVDAIDLTVQDASHGQVVGSPALAQQHSLAVGDASQSQTAESPALTQEHALSVDDATQAQAVDALTLTQDHQLAVQDTEHGHTAESVTLVVGGIDLDVDDASHDQTADSPSLTQTHVLAADDSTQAQSADSLALTQVHDLAVGDAGHAQAADGLTLVQAHELAIQDATQSQTADSVTLTASDEIDLVIQDAFHSQTADGVALTQLHLLVVADALHAQLAEAVTLGLLGTPRFASRSAPRLRAIGRTDPAVHTTASDAAHVHIDTAAAEEVTFT